MSQREPKPPMAGQKPSIPALGAANRGKRTERIPDPFERYLRGLIEFLNADIDESTWEGIRDQLAWNFEMGFTLHATGRSNPKTGVTPVRWEFPAALGLPALFGGVKVVNLDVLKRLQEQGRRLLVGLFRKEGEQALEPLNTYLKHVPLVARFGHEGRIYFTHDVKGFDQRFWDKICIILQRPDWPDFLGLCPACGFFFRKDRADQIYDTDACRKAAWREREGYIPEKPRRKVFKS